VDPTLTGTLNSFLAADNVTATYARTAGETVLGGPYTIIVNHVGQGTAFAPLTKHDITVNLGKWMTEMAGRGGDIGSDPSALLVPLLTEEFGLKLESKKVPLDLLVIDRIEKTPTEN